MLIKWVLFRDNDTKFWIAQALEHDICVQARYPGQLARRMIANVEIYTPDELAKIPPAPQKFHDMWESPLYLRKTTEIKNDQDRR